MVSFVWPAAALFYERVVELSLPVLLLIFHVAMSPHATHAATSLEKLLSDPSDPEFLTSLIPFVSNLPSFESSQLPGSEHAPIHHIYLVYI